MDTTITAEVGPIPRKADAPRKRYFIKTRGVKVGNSKRKYARRRPISVPAIKVRVSSVHWYGAGKAWKRDVAKHGIYLARQLRLEKIEAAAKAERNRIRADVNAQLGKGASDGGTR